MASWFGSRRAAEAAPSPPPAHFGSQSANAGAASLELIRYNPDTEKFEVGAQAIAVLKATRGPVGVVAVAGRARQGKSFILNQLLGRSGGFEVAPTHRPCTKGLWMWSAPVSHTGPDGAKYSLVLLDTEGIDAYDQTAQYSTQIFSLAVLLSSLFIYNQLGPIDEAALDRLSLVTEMTKHIRVRAGSGAVEDPSDLAAFTPAFIWLLRDFYLKLEEEGRPVSPRDYLETALQQLAGPGAAVDAKNQVRASIKSLFPDRDCFTLVRPVNDEDALARLDSLPPTALRPEFRSGLTRLTKLVFNKAQPKRLGTQVLTGPLLAGLAEAYCQAINAGAVPTIATAWQGVAEAECRRAADAAEAAYAAAIPADAPADEAELEAAHQRALAAAQRVFDDIAIGEESVKAANEGRWKAACGARFRELKERKLATAALACERAINDATTRLAALVRNDATTLDDLRREAATFEAAYTASKEASGPTKWPRFAHFMRESYAGALRDLAARQEKAQAAAAAAAAQRAETALTRVTAVESEAAALRTRLSQTEAGLAAERQALALERQRVAALETQLVQVRQSVEGDRARSVQEAEQRARALAGPLELQLAAAHSECEALRRQAAASMAETRSMGDRLGALAAERDAAHTALLAGQAAKAAAEDRAARLSTEVDQLRQQVAAQQAQQRAVQEASWNVPSPAAARASAGAVAAGGRDVDMVESPAPNGPPAAVSTGPLAGPRGAGAGVNTAKMTINDMKQWLMEHGQEGLAWELANKRSKKADWEAAIRNA